MRAPTSSSSSSDAHNEDASILTVHGRGKLVDVLFDGSNFPTWSKAIKIALYSQGKLGFITGKCKKPEANSPSLEQWERDDSMVMGWLLSSMESQLSDVFACAGSAKTLWDKLNLSFAGGRVMIREDMWQRDDSQAVFYASLKKILDEVESACEIPKPKIGEFGAQKLIDILKHVADNCNIRRNYKVVDDDSEITQSDTHVEEGSNMSMGSGFNPHFVSAVVHQILEMMKDKQGMDNMENASPSGAGPYIPLHDGPEATTVENEQKEIDSRLMIVLLIASLIIPTSFSLYGLYSSAAYHSDVQTVGFYGFLASNSMAMVLCLMAIVLFFFLPVAGPTSRRVLSWAYSLTAVSLMLMVMGFIFGSIAVLPLIPGIVVSSITGTFLIFYLIFRAFYGFRS